MRVGDVQKRSAIFALVLKPKALTIASITSVTITRADGISMADGDLEVDTMPLLDDTSLIVTFGLAGGQPYVDYRVTIAVAASDGDVFVRDVFQAVVPTLG